MKNLNLIITGLVAVLLILTGVEAMAQGSLTPPGMPGAGMKTLDQVEPRTPISTVPYTTTQPGSYYPTPTTPPARSWAPTARSYLRETTRIPGRTSQSIRRR